MRHALIALALVAFGGGAACAQTAAPPSEPKGTLSEKLDQSNGVVKPPEHVDPNMPTHAPPPAKTPMPVIKPPVERNGEKVVPK